MFKYNKNNLYDRCGAISVPIDIDRIPTSTGKFTEVCGEKIPVINFNFQPSVKFSRAICLKTIFGYIPIENITKFKDIFNHHKYCKDETEWSFLYNEKSATTKSKEQVKKLSLTLGKHWNEK